MVAKTDHICVCVCTYKRIKLLEHLLKKLQNQKTDGLFTYSIVVVDNDYKQSAKNIVADIKQKFLTAIYYYIEPEKNFALVRNKAVQNATGDFVAFIDDDEFPVNTWLLNLYKTHNEYRADGVLGPVKPHFEEEPPEWIIKGKLCERRSFKTGTILRNPKDTRTGNVLLTKKIFNDEENLFNPDFGRTGGEDVDFFKRMIEKGQKFIWCDEAPVYEAVPQERCKRSYFLRRALLRGVINSKDASLNSILKSVIAFLTYTVMLPFSVLIGQHIFMKYLIKNCDHIGKLLGVFGLKVVKERTF